MLDITPASNEVEIFELAQKYRNDEEARLLAKRTGREPIQIHTALNIRDMERPKELLRGVFPQRGIGSITGPTMQYKSFVALDLALRIVNNKPWFGHQHSLPHKKKTALLCLGEGQFDAQVRLEAALEAHQFSDEGLYYVLRPGDLSDRAWVSELIELAEDINPDVIIFDSGTDFYGPINEDSSSDAQRVIDSMKALSERFNAMVLVVAHTGHGDTDRQRGSSRWRQAWDAEILVKDHAITCMKYKYGEKFDTVNFEMRPAADSIAVFPSDAAVVYPASYKILMGAEKAMTAGQIAQVLGITKQAVQKQLDELEDRGLAEKITKGQTNYWEGIE